MVVKLTKNKLRSIITESVHKILSEMRRVVDNFSVIESIMDFSSDDDFYFVQIIKRWKDNKDKSGASDERDRGKIDGVYHGGAWYLKSWRIHSAQELEDLKPEIIKICEENNARAYITVNTRSTKETDSFVKIYRSRYNPSDARYAHADDIVAGQAKSGPNWKDTRVRLFLDIDTPDKKIWSEVSRMLDYYNIKVLGSYETPSGGLHIILANKNNRNLWAFRKECEKFDRYRDLGRQATVHANEDGKLLLYSNVETQGY